MIFRYCAWCASGHPNEKDCISAKEPLKIVYNKLSQPSGLLLWGLGFGRQFHRGPFLRACGEGQWQEMVTSRQLRITDSLIPQYAQMGLFVALHYTVLGLGESRLLSSSQSLWGLQGFYTVVSVHEKNREVGCALISSWVHWCTFLPMELLQFKENQQFLFVSGPY